MMNSQQLCKDKIYLIAIEARCHAEGIVPTDIHLEQLIKLRKSLTNNEEEKNIKTQTATS